MSDPGPKDLLIFHIAGDKYSHLLKVLDNLAMHCD